MLVVVRQNPPCLRCALRHLSVANGFKSVHPSGHPISHSTHVGFSCPPSLAITAWSNRSEDRSAPLFRVSEAGELPLLIDATGVGQDFAAAGRPFRGFVVSKFPRFSASLAFGVGQCFAACSSPTCTFLPLWYAVLPSAPRQSVTCAQLLPPFGTFGVGHNPASFAAVGRSNVKSSDNTPSRIEPHFGKVSEHADKSSSHKER